MRLYWSTGDGGAELVGSDGALVSAIAPPWAVDANGVSVPTSYRIEGSTLVQVVAHHSAAHPVVADPSFHLGFTGLVVRWSQSEARWLTGLNLGLTAAAVGSMCVGPHAPLCAAAVFGIWHATQSLTDWAINQLYARGCRMETRLAPWTSTYIRC